MSILSKITKKDLVYWIIILVILLIVATTVRLSSNTIVEFIGFAGTIVSILLAVVAIIYSFIEHSSADETLYSIREASSTIKELSAEMENSVDNIGRMKEELCATFERTSKYSADRITECIIKTVKPISSDYKSSQSDTSTVLSNEKNETETLDIWDTKNLHNLLIGVGELCFHSIYHLYLLCFYKKKDNVNTFFNWYIQNICGEDKANAFVNSHVVMFTIFSRLKLINVSLDFGADSNSSDLSKEYFILRGVSYHSSLQTVMVNILKNSITSSALVKIGEYVENVAE